MYRNIRFSNNFLVLRVSPREFFLVSELIHHSSAMDTQETNRAVVFLAVMTQELNPEVSCPDERIFDEEGLHLAGVSGFESAEILPLFRFHWVAIRHGDAEVPEDGAEELVVCQDDGVDQDVVAELNNEEFVGR